MTLARALAGLLRNDARRIVRDRFLLGSAAYILSTATAMRWVLPWLDRETRTANGFALASYYAPLVSYLVAVLASVLVGTIGAFLLLESREERSIHAVLVSPLPIRAYVAVAATVMALTAAAIAVAEGLLIRVGVPSLPALVPIAAVAGLSAPIIALFVATFSSNKVEAFALMKVVGLVAIVPPASWFLDAPWQYLAAVLPTYWSIKSWWLAESGATAWWPWLAGGTLVSIAALFLVSYWFERVIRR